MRTGAVYHPGSVFALGHTVQLPDLYIGYRTCQSDRECPKAPQDMSVPSDPIHSHSLNRHAYKIGSQALL